jgi:hypothetical protein
VVFSMTTGSAGVTVGGVSAGVAIVSTTAGAGGAGSGSSIRSAVRARVGRPNRPAKYAAMPTAATMMTIETTRVVGSRPSPFMLREQCTLRAAGGFAF